MQKFAVSVFILFSIILSACSDTGIISGKSAKTKETIIAEKGDDPSIFMYATGLKEESYDDLANKVGIYRPSRSLSRSTSLPPAVDHSSNMPPVGNQGSQGSCTAWAIVYAAKSFQEGREELWDLSSASHQFSPSWAFNQVKMDFFGTYAAQMSDVFDLLVDKGVDTLDSFSYNQNDIDRLPDFESFRRADRYRSASWQVMAKNISDIKTVLAQGLVVPFSMRLKTDFYKISPSDPIFDDLSGDFGGGHALTIVGYDDNKIDSFGNKGAFKFVNSWGQNWGTWKDDNDESKGKGYGWISYALIEAASNPLNFIAYYFTDTENVDRNLVSRIVAPAYHGENSGIVPFVIETDSTVPVTKVEFQMRGHMSGEDFKLIHTATDPEIVNALEVFRFNWDTTPLRDDTYYFKITAFDADGNQDTSEIKVFTRHPRPTITITPERGSINQGTVNIRVTVTDPENTGETVKTCTFYINPPNAPQIIHTINETKSVYEYALDSTLFANGKVYVSANIEWTNELLLKVGYLNDFIINNQVCEEFTATNMEHVAAGRAEKYTYWWINYARTIGSAEDLGQLGSVWYSPTTTIRMTADGYYEKGSCETLGCISSKNSEHITANRAYNCGSIYFPVACATGSNQNLGAAYQWYDQTSSIKQTSEGHWELCE